MQYTTKKEFLKQGNWQI